MNPEIIRNFTLHNIMYIFQPHSRFKHSKNTDVMPYKFAQLFPCVIYAQCHDKNNTNNTRTIDEKIETTIKKDEFE